MVQCVNLAADSRRKPRGIAGLAHFQVHATDLIAQVSAIGLGQWDIEARPYSVAIAAKPAVPEGVQHGLITSRIQLVQHAQVRWAVNVGCPVEVASGVADHSVRVGSSGPAREAVQYRLLAGRIQLVHHARSRCAAASLVAHAPPGLRGFPGPAPSFEEPRLSTTATGRRARRPRSRGTAPRLMQAPGYRKSMRHYTRVRAPPHHRQASYARRGWWLVVVPAGRWLCRGSIVHRWALLCRDRGFWDLQQNLPNKAISQNLRRSLPCLRSEEHTSELQSLRHLVCRLLLDK